MNPLLSICLLFLLLIQTFPADCCIEHERNALLKFKGSLNDPSNSLASWRGDECCKWAGIRCSNQTGHVVKLDLQCYDYNHSLSGKINPALLLLTDLKHLDLSYNNFSGNKFPKFIGSFSHLKYLDLSFTGLSGPIPPQLGNLSKLQYLDLSYMPDTFVYDVWWLSHLASLKYLYMSEVNFRDSREWLQAMNMLPHLDTLSLYRNGLTTIPTSINLANFSSLEDLSIIDNCFNTKMPDWIGKLPNMKELQLMGCCFIGPISNQLGNLTSLNSLMFWDELSEGPLPPLHNLKNLTKLKITDVNIGEDIRDVISKLADDTLYNLDALCLANLSLTGNLTGLLSKIPNIRNLLLSSNSLNGTIPTSIGNFTWLEHLFLDDNSFIGEVSENHFTSLSMLRHLSLSYNFINFTVSKNWIPPFQLTSLALDGCNLGPHFPYWLQNQSGIDYIGLSDNRIIDTIPDWFWNFPSLNSVNLSNNNVRGRMPFSFQHLMSLEYLFLQNNQIEGQVPSLPNSIENVDLSNNFFHGTIEELLCGLDSLSIISIARNNLSQSLPRCWPTTLTVVNMGHNNISGDIPIALDNLCSLIILQLNNNSITGELPSTLESCRSLTILDVGENKLSGQIPKWIGKNLTNLEILRLRSNMFFGKIPIQIMHMANLQVLDLSTNQLSGSIPHNMKLFAMASSRENNNNSAYLDFPKTESNYYEVSISVITKDLKLEFSTTLSLFKSIDLSSNSLTGDIPQTITKLLGLQSLNLSNNHFHGSISLQIGDMHSMESLDISMNQLSGMIPQSLGNLNFLTTLNLSYNNLSGKIPTGNQLQTLDDPYIYIGNEYLCGFPLSKSCNTSGILSGYETDANNDSDRMFLYLFVVLGFGFGFWIVCGILIFKANWRYCFFRAVDNGVDWLFVFWVVNVVRLLKNLKNNNDE